MGDDRKEMDVHLKSYLNPFPAPSRTLHQYLYWFDKTADLSTIHLEAGPGNEPDFF